MVLLSFDFETTGLNPEINQVIEVGAVLFSTEQDQQLMSQGYLVDHEISIPPEITKITGIKKQMIDKFGLSSKTALSTFLNMAEMADAYVGQNVLDFDVPFLRNWAKAEGETVPERLVIDTKTDLPGVVSKHLGYMAADAGFLNPFPHRAVSDCMTVLRLVSMHNIDDIVVRAKSPRVTLAADVSFDNNHLAKERGYYWGPSRGFEEKVWFKLIKELELEKEAQEAPFNVSKVELTPVKK